MRVSFDRSALHGERFHLLESSPLRRLTAQGRVLVYHTPIFLDETISEYGSGRGSGDWRRHLEFALDICSGGLFLSKNEIWHNELVAGKGPFARYLFPSRPTGRYRRSQQGWIEQLRHIAKTDDISQEWQAGQAERDDTNQKKNNQLRIFRTVRQEISHAIKDRQIIGPLDRASFALYRRAEFLRMGRLLMKLVHPGRTGILSDIWARSPDKFPFYSAFVDGVVYSAFYAATEHNERLDRNAQADYEQLAYLTWLDVFVSDDQRFLRRAFDTLWKPRGKRLVTSLEFTTLLPAIA